MFSRVVNTILGSIQSSENQKTGPKVYWDLAVIYQTYLRISKHDLDTQ